MQDLVDAGSCSQPTSGKDYRGGDWADWRGRQEGPKEEQSAKRNMSTTPCPKQSAIVALFCLLR